MQVTLTRSGDYAVRAVLDVAAHHESGRRKKREIATTMKIPSGYLSHVLAKLVRAEILVATAGPAGGYELAHAPQAISLLSVVEAIDGPVKIERCVLRGIPCSSDGICAVHDAWTAAQQTMAAQLDRTTFADLLERDRQLGGLIRRT